MRLPVDLASPLLPPKPGAHTPCLLLYSLFQQHNFFSLRGIWNYLTLGILLGAIIMLL